MPLIVPDVGEVIILDSMLAGIGIAGWFVLLYENNLTPDQDTVFTDFVEATYDGYAAQPVNFGSASIVGHKGTIVGSAPLSFVVATTGSPDTIYGYLVADANTGEVVYAEKFASPQVMENAGDTINITLSFTGNSEF